MKSSKRNIHYMATLAMLCGLLIVMGMTGIEFSPLPIIKASSMHIPAILGAALSSPAEQIKKKSRSDRNDFSFLAYTTQFDTMQR